MPKIKYDEQTEFYKKIVNNIKFYAAQNGNSNSTAQIAKRVNIPQSTLNDKFNSPRKLTLEDLYKISIGLKVDIHTLME